MQPLEAIKLANEIVKLDEQRDRIWEELLANAGEQALEILRYVQNSNE